MIVGSESDALIAHKKVLAEMTPAQKRAMAREVMLTSGAVGADDRKRHDAGLAVLVNLEEHKSEGCLESLDYWHRLIFPNQGYSE